MTSSLLLAYFMAQSEAETATTTAESSEAAGFVKCKVGLISDTHNDIELIKGAVKIFEERGCDIVLHAGDITLPATIPYFQGINIKFVRGNGEREYEVMKSKIEEIGGEIFDEFYNFEYDGKSFIVTHGHSRGLMDEILSEKKYDYLIRGHLHRRIDKMEGNMRHINPGSLG